MDISVVIPTYNRAGLLPHTLQAVLEQTLPPRQIIVVDDGSTDETSRILEQFGSAVTAIPIANSGSIVARNVGMQAAFSRWVAFCDSDDLWQPGFLARMAALWEAEPRIKVAYGNFRIVRDGIWSVRSKFDDAPSRFWDGLDRLSEGLGVFRQPIVDRLIQFQPFFPSTCVADRQAMLDAGGWDESVGRTVGDDFGTVLRMGEFAPFGVLMDAMVGIRKHADNFSASTRNMNLGDANILEHVLATRPTLAPLAGLIRESVTRRRLDALHDAWTAGDHGAVQAIHAQLPPAATPWKAKIKYYLSRSLASRTCQTRSAQSVAKVKP